MAGRLVGGKLDESLGGRSVELKIFHLQLQSPDEGLFFLMGEEIDVASMSKNSALMAEE